MEAITVLGLGQKDVRRHGERFGLAESLIGNLCMASDVRASRTLADDNHRLIASVRAIVICWLHRSYVIGELDFLRQLNQCWHSARPQIERVFVMIKRTFLTKKSKKRVSHYQCRSPFGCNMGTRVAYLPELVTFCSNLPCGPRPK